MKLKLKEQQRQWHALLLLDPVHGVHGHEINNRTPALENPEQRFEVTCSAWSIIACVVRPVIPCQFGSRRDVCARVQCETSPFAVLFFLRNFRVRVIQVVVQEKELVHDTVGDCALSGLVRVAQRENSGIGFASSGFRSFEVRTDEVVLEEFSCLFWYVDGVFINGFPAIGSASSDGIFRILPTGVQTDKRAGSEKR